MEKITHVIVWIWATIRIILRNDFTSLVASSGSDGDNTISLVNIVSAWCRDEGLLCAIDFNETFAFFFAVAVPG